MNFDDLDDELHHTRMSFGDHLEELRLHLIRAMVGFAICLFIGFILDAVGTATGWPVGLGFPVLQQIKKPVEDAMRQFYADRVARAQEELRAGAATAVEINTPRPFTITLNSHELADAVGVEKKGENHPVQLSAKLPPLEVAIALNDANMVIGKQMGLTTLSVQEGFVVYFKVSIVCGIVLSSPWLFYQFWSFVGAGLYSHERRYVYRSLFPSIVLFLAGVFLCQFVVLPNAVRALLAFNAWLNLDPDLRLSEWLGFALILPLVFGISFQTPLVMFALERIGIVSVEDFRSQRKIALFALAFLSAILTPTPDVVTMLWLLVPMYGLYELGIVVCAWAARNDPADIDAPNPEEPVGV